MEIARTIRFFNQYRRITLIERRHNNIVTVNCQKSRIVGYFHCVFLISSRIFERNQNRFQELPGRSRMNKKRIRTI